MCLAVPGKIETIFDLNDLRMGKVNFGGVRKSICLQYTPDALVGDYVLVHVGFAISQMDEEEARKTYELLRMSSDFGEELGVDDAGEGN